ncbi:BamA/TamA family outer membrane protein [Mucilaginibacter sp. AW1-3]
MRKYLSFFFLVGCCFTLKAQNDTLHKGSNFEPAKHAAIDSSAQRDLMDILHRMLRGKATPENSKPKKVIFSVVPSAGYSLSTGFGVNINGNVEFYTSSDISKTNISYIGASAFIDTKNQRSLISLINIWTPNNDYDIVVNFRWLKYPTNTYGFGGFTGVGQTNPIDFNYVKLYPTLLKRVIPNYYMGIGYNLDYHTNFIEKGNLDGSESDLSKYGKPYTTVSSGVNLNLLYDKRGNPVNPISGGYGNIIFRQNTTWLGSDVNWESLIVDLRKYVRLSQRNNNVLAFWSYSWFTFNGKAPYLDLPSTGWDINNISGRGYVIGRFTGKDMLYAEAEYRFTITHSGMLGGVLFTNAQSVAEYPDGGFKKVIPAVGTGLRLKLNKHSNTNICVDYGVGINGSRGFFVNLGEAF